ncbi:helix-turn-helix transcriptional regulator [Noviherbaspirillum sp. CPCC 100848]|uniref:Helix-turn-helix transcriptional regulator n=1 Tax=Noviherbaspirillum album TaxID=3080276 RepID=A0ABU6J4S5_9BURK|nr:helix-turn-helix transcriptional regulator [Noviherbaspirillum sp. CPCC 100848]MEC4718610.1 helix-turn-helix transcriptional regulator [Noviherbaspirillum sp. CPCC 100848]
MPPVPLSSLIPLDSQSYLNISHDPVRGWLYNDWIGYQTVGSVQEGCERILDLMIEHRAFKVLNDNTRVLGIWSGAASWVATDWFPRMRGAGMQRFAWIYSASRFSQISTDTTLSLLDTGASVKVFYETSEAFEWLDQSDQREALMTAWIEQNRREGTPPQVISAVLSHHWTPARAWREHLGISQAQMAARLGISQLEYAARETVLHLNAGHREQIAAVLGVRSELLEV